MKLLNRLKLDAVTQATARGHKLGRAWTNYELKDQEGNTWDERRVNYCVHCLAPVLVSTDLRAMLGKLDGRALEGPCPGAKRERPTFRLDTRDSSGQLVLRLASPLHEASLKAALTDYMARLDLSLRLASLEERESLLKELRAKVAATQDVLDVLEAASQGSRKQPG